MITPRTECIIKHISSKYVADIGTDHAYIPIALIERGICERVTATDLNAGPLAIAAQNIKKHGVENRIELRLGNGLMPIVDGECEECIIAGMGGAAIIDILKQHTPNCRYVLQPMNCQYDLRKFLYENGFVITDEDIATEGFKVYNIILAQKGKWTDETDEFHFHLPKRLKAHKLYPELAAKKMREFTKIKTGLEKSAVPDTELISLYENMIRQLKNETNL